MKQWPVYVSMVEERGCGHQHETAKAAYNCGNGKSQVCRVKRTRPDQYGERIVTYVRMFT